MKIKLYTFLLSLFISISFYAQTPYHRISIDSSLAPFYHGVASGDPTSNSVIIWTRVSTAETEAIVNWKVAIDTAMANIVQQGTTTTNELKDFTVKIDVQNLQPNTYYFYEFETESNLSLRGRTKTLPIGNTNQLRFAVVSCASFPHGYFNAYKLIENRNDVDAVIHLGDYIYEYGKDEYGTLRIPEPETEITTLADYRMRHNIYKLDSMLMRLHQQYPFFTVWDDHEFADNAFVDGAENHQPDTEGNWFDRKEVALQAYLEWMPMRIIDQSNPIKIFRKYSFGNLMDLYLLDTRIFSRKEQDFVASLTGQDDSTHYLIGDEQFNWLKTELQNSTAQWKVIGQQVMVAPFKVLNIAFNSDQWDGYPTERNKFFNMINSLGVNNLVILTGDIHSAWAMDLPFDTIPYNKNTGQGSVGVEFVTTAVTSPAIPISGIFGELAQPLVEQVLKDNNKHLKYNDMVNRGYLILDITPTKAQSDFFNVATIENINYNDIYKTSYYTLDSANHLQKANAATQLLAPQPIKAPYNIRVENITTISNNINIDVSGVYPNPFVDNFTLNFAIHQQDNLTIKLYDLKGELAFEYALGTMTKGVHFENIKIDNIPNGMYAMSISGNNTFFITKVIKTK